MVMVKKQQKVGASSGNTDKLKASNIPASVLRIGTWEIPFNLCDRKGYVVVEHPITQVMVPEL